MHDYKFRQSDSGFDKHQGPMRWKLFGAIALLLAAGIVFAMLRIDFTGDSSSQDSEADAEVIPLSLPPKPMPLQSTGAVQSSGATVFVVTV